MSFLWSSIIGFFLGFSFGVGCALAVLYSIYMGGYRAAVKDCLQSVVPKRLIAARSKALKLAQQEDLSPQE